jgi:hypothetical protein
VVSYAFVAICGRWGTVVGHPCNMVQLDRGLVEANWRVGIDRRLVGASLFDHRLAGVSNLADGRDGGRWPKP